MGFNNNNYTENFNQNITIILEKKKTDSRKVNIYEYNYIKHVHSV